MGNGKGEAESERDGMEAAAAAAPTKTDFHKMVINNNTTRPIGMCVFLGAHTTPKIVNSMPFIRSHSFPRACTLNTSLLAAVEITKINLTLLRFGPQQSAMESDADGV